MHCKTAALLVALAILPATTAHAGYDGTEAEQQACTSDVFRLCSDFIPDEAPILACLQAKHTQLSAACEPVIFPHAASIKRHARSRARA